MKKDYKKPEIKSVRLLAAETLMTGSKLSVSDDDNAAVMDASNFYSNQESEHDIWGDDSSSMWK